MKNYHEEKLPTPDAVADILASEILARIIDKPFRHADLKQAVLDAMNKLACFAIDDTGNEEDDAPLDFEVVRDEILSAVAAEFDTHGNPDDASLLNLRLAVEFAIKNIFDYYFVR